MNKIEQYRALEKSLTEKYKDVHENLVSLSDEDFVEGKLCSSGYERIKQQCDYIPYREDVVISVPKAYAGGFKDALDYMGARELSYIKKDNRYTAIMSLVLLAAGILCIALGFLLEALKANMVKEIIIIASWVFVWAAVEKWFFERKRLREQRFSLLQILSAKIIVK